jgi:predicted metal-binding protein
MKKTKDLTPYIEMALKRGVDDAVVVATSQVVTAAWVRMKCQFGCVGYGQSLCCPPRTPTHGEMREILDSYSRAILFHRHISEGSKKVARISEIAVDVELALFLAGYYKAWTLASGPCGRCKACSMDACVHADRARPSMEACGIDVFATARGCGLPIQVVKDYRDERNFYALVLVD